ncbi:MAG: polymer-forming cytoskeletal protein [Chloroflexota bacterium]
MSEQAGGRRFLGFRRRGAGIQEIVGYQVGDVQSEKPVLVAEPAVIIGDLLTPKAVIAGLVCGYVVAREVTVQKSGQVWGDVFAASLLIEPGGRVHGWFSTLSEDSYLLLYSGQSSPLDLALSDRLDLPAGLMRDELRAALESELANPASPRVNTLRLLQAEAAEAVAARADLQGRLADEVNGVRNQMQAETAAVREELLRARLELSRLRQEKEQVEEALGLCHDRFEAEANELVAVRALLDERTAALEELQAAYDQLYLELSIRRTGR